VNINEEVDDEFFIDMIFSPFQIQRESRSEGIMGRNENDVNDMWNSIVATMQKPP